MGTKGTITDKGQRIAPWSQLNALCLKVNASLAPVTSQLGAGGLQAAYTWDFLNLYPVKVSGGPHSSL